MKGVDILKFGLCLAGGGIKGSAHIGVLKAFEERHIKIDMISGASSGSIVATLYAIGYSADEIYDFFKKYAKDIKYVDVKNIFKLISGLIIKKQISITGLTTGKKLEDYVRKTCLKKGIENIGDVAFPLYISSVDLKNGNTYIFTNSNCKSKDDLILINDIDIGIAVRASCSYPGVFEPVKWNNTELIDGGIRENVPWKVMKNCGADYVMTVVFSSSTKKNCTKNMINVVDCSLSYLQNELYRYEINGSDEVLKIQTGDVGLLDSDKVDELYEIGYKAGRMAMNYMFFH